MSQIKHTKGGTLRTGTKWVVILIMLASSTTVFAEILPMINEESLLLESAQTGASCDKKNEFKEQSPKNDPREFWESSAAAGSDFIFFDRKNWALTICREGKIISAVFEGSKDMVEVVFVSDDFNGNLTDEKKKATLPFFGDLNGDGKFEFVIFSGQCVEGPCMGENILYQIDGKRIRKLYSISNAEMLTSFEEKGNKGFGLEIFCFNFDFGVEYYYLGVAEFINKKLTLLPYRQIPKKYPETFRDFSSRNPEPSSIQKLIFRAYKDEPIEQLTEIYDAILQTEPELPGVHCNPLGIIETIAGSLPSDQ